MCSCGLCVRKVWESLVQCREASIATDDDNDDDDSGGGDDDDDDDDHVHLMSEKLEGEGKEQEQEEERQEN